MLGIKTHQKRAKLLSLAGAYTSLAQLRPHPDKQFTAVCYIVTVSIFHDMFVTVFNNPDFFFLNLCPAA